MINISLGDYHRTYFYGTIWREYSFIELSRHDVDSNFVCVWNRNSVDIRYSTSEKVNIAVYKFQFCDAS